MSTTTNPLPHSMTTTTEPSSLPISSRIDLLQSLPYDVVITILSFLTQQDCLRCLEVCREWCTLIPMYARETVFREIQLDEQYLGDNKSMHKFLGPHVDAVSFKKCHRLDRVLDMLHAKQCSNIQRLGKYICETSKFHGWSMVESETHCHGDKAIAHVPWDYRLATGVCG
ncbi:predicted protein [Lichtheimia corymbifera JMRC:FSU:9682]|uniref:F-box domain-containing protein n=1 Tax=Lichtheimia corymbifera JMRC:FSU:9682 TaxID=1263082 RepID=A0A068S562_9FUNG|nr:predicted protein [Lichtheimia corymbifera JMRC:FSU:9682]